MENGPPKRKPGYGPGDAESKVDNDFHQTTNRTDVIIIHIITTRRRGRRLLVNILTAFNLDSHYAGLVNDVLDVVTTLTDYLRCKSVHTATC